MVLNCCLVRIMKRITKSGKSTRGKSSKAPRNEEEETEEVVKPVESKLKLGQFKLQAKSKLQKAGGSKPIISEEDKSVSEVVSSSSIKGKLSGEVDNKLEVGKTENVFNKTEIKVETDEQFKLTNVKTENVLEDDSSKSKIKREHIKLEYDSAPPAKIKKEEDNDFKLKFDGDYPPHWEETLNHLREMRRSHDAPVDSMGCDQCMDDKSNAKDQRYQALLSLMLSSQTKDEVTHGAMQRLIKHGCSVKNILDTPNEKLEELIRPVGFYRRKVQYIKESSRMIVDKFNGDIPKGLQELCTLKGVGPKMAHLCMKTAWGEVTGIGVDTHVHRISNRMGWVKSKTPEETRKQLESWLPKELWTEINHLLVGFGQQVCKPVSPQCATCLNYQLCPYGTKKLKT